MSWWCSSARRKIALLVGDDLPGGETSAVEQHLRRCPACREYFTDLTRAREAMLDTAVPDRVLAHRPLWPALCHRLDSGPAATGSRVSGWLPVGALAAASLAIILVLLDLPASSHPRRAVDAAAAGPLVGVPDDLVVRRVADDPWEFDDRGPWTPAGVISTTPSYYRLETAAPVSYLGEDF
jgi:anti-sigma factor RsiW